MSNIIRMPTKPVSTFSSESDLYFDVWERPAYFKGNDKHYEDPKHKHIVRMHNNEPVSIGLVGKSYKLLKNKPLFEGIEDTFIDEMTTEELSNVKRVDRTSYMGGKCFRDYIFPNINIDIGSKYSNVAFRAIVINGYDGTSSFKFYHGAIDFFCTNGMVTGSYDMMIKRHTAGLTIPNLTNKLRGSINIFFKQAEQWSKWVGKEISDESAEECFKTMPNISERRLQQLMRQFLIECNTHGRTVWALYSAATYYATSNEGDFTVRETNKNHQAATLMNREDQVRRWLNTESFQQLAA